MPVQRPKGSETLTPCGCQFRVIRVLLAMGRRLGDFGELRKNLRIDEVRDHRMDLDVVLLRNLVEIR